MAELRRGRRQRVLGPPPRRRARAVLGLIVAEPRSNHDELVTGDPAPISRLGLGTYAPRFDPERAGPSGGETGLRIRDDRRRSIASRERAVEAPDTSRTAACMLRRRRHAIAGLVRCRSATI